MTNQRVRISLSDLPPRPRAVRDTELENIFGGCSQTWCHTNADCCRRKCTAMQQGQAWVKRCEGGPLTH